jgi:hypothetical protein
MSGNSGGHGGESHADESKQEYAPNLPRPSRSPTMDEKIIICDGCGKELEYIGQVHEFFNKDGEPELCGRGKEVKMKFCSNLLDRMFGKFFS